MASYNVNGKKPPAELNLNPWIGAPSSTDGSKPGIVVIGFQEVVPLSAGNVLAGSALTNIRAWDRLIAAELNGKEW